MFVRNILLFVVVMSICVTAANYRVGVVSDYFYWKENATNDPSSEVLLTESGLRYGVKAQIGFQPSSSLQLSIPLEFLMGRPFYDGSLQDGTPFESRTLYKDFKGSLDLKVRLGNAISLDPGIDFRRWTRVLSSLGYSEAHSDFGYIERWSYLALGAKFTLSHQNLNARFGLSYPIQINEVVELNLSDETSTDLHLSPKPNIIPSFQLNWTSNTWSVGLEFERVLFDRSNYGTLLAGDRAYLFSGYQPRSESLTAKLNLMYALPFGDSNHHSKENK